MMRTVGRLVSVLAVVVFLSAFRADNVITIFTIGDSTMANKDIKGGKLERGWGMMLRHCFSDDVRVDNHAQNGRSSKSFIDEGRWDKVLGLIKPGDYVFIQFGHNDEKPDEKRHTVPGSTFDDNLRKFVRETRERGGIPVLFNSVVRRNFSGSKTAVTDDDLRTNSSAGLKEGEVLIDTHGDYIVAPLNVSMRTGLLMIWSSRSVWKAQRNCTCGIFPERLRRSQKGVRTTHIIIYMVQVSLPDCLPTRLRGRSLP